MSVQLACSHQLMGKNPTRCVCEEYGRDIGEKSSKDAIISELERMLSVCEYAEVKAFIPLLIDHIKSGNAR